MIWPEIWRKIKAFPPFELRTRAWYYSKCKKICQIRISRTNLNNYQWQHKFRNDFFCMHHHIWENHPNKESGMSLKRKNKLWSKATKAWTHPLFLNYWWTSDGMVICEQFRGKKVLDWWIMFTKYSKWWSALQIV